jgi:hypothetical protein
MTSPRERNKIGKKEKRRIMMQKNHIQSQISKRRVRDMTSQHDIISN